MEEDKYKYIAFISYRHNELDKFVAENLHRLIETYKMPAPVVEKYNIRDNNFRRVFRDQEELPLSSNLEDPIVEALKESKFLIVICSPRLKESKWCKKEIESFIKMHGRNSILCVLVEGEPDESFPEILRYHEEKVITKTGKERIKKVPCEPLAMDVRGKDKKEILANLKKELVRVIAPLYNLDYDDIKRRHEEREQKRKANILKVITCASVVFAIYSFILFYNIYRSNAKLKYDQSITLAKSANTLFAKDDRKGAIKIAYQSVTKYNDIKMPITTDGIFQLTQNLGLYYLNNYNYNAISQLDTSGIVKSIKTNSNGNLLLSYDDSGEVILWDLVTEKKIKVVNCNLSLSELNEDKAFTFVGEKGFAYVDMKDVYYLDLDGKEIKKFSFEDEVKSVAASNDGKYIAIQNYETTDVYETEKFKLVASYKEPSEEVYNRTLVFDTEGENLLFVTLKRTKVNNVYDIKIYTLNIKKNKVINTYKMTGLSIQKMLFDGDKVFVLASNYKGLFSGDCLLISYNYKTGKKHWKVVVEGISGKDIEISHSKDGYGTIMLSDWISAKMYDLKTGKKLVEEARGAGAAFIHDVGGGYRIFTTKGDIIWIKNTDNIYSIIPSLSSYFYFRLSNYEQFLYANKTYVAITSTDNRIIIYGHYQNDDIKEIEYQKREYKDLEDDEKEDIVNDYNFDKKYLISNIFYSDDKKILFVVYNNSELEVYNNDKKELITTVKSIYKNMKHFIAKTEDNQYIIGDSYNGYVFNKEFKLLARVNYLHDYHDGKLILSEDQKIFYEVPLYSSKEVIIKAEEYLKGKE